jgi:hypothetical protein
MAILPINFNPPFSYFSLLQSLTVLEYIIKGGSERVSQQCKDNIFSIQTLKDFQYVDKDGKDQGANGTQCTHYICSTTYTACA